MCFASQNKFFKSPDRLSGRNDVTSDKLSIRPDIRQFFLFVFEKIRTRTPRVCVALKTIWS